MDIETLSKKVSQRVTELLVDREDPTGKPIQERDSHRFYLAHHYVFSWYDTLLKELESQSNLDKTILMKVKQQIQLGLNESKTALLSEVSLPPEEHLIRAIEDNDTALFDASMALGVDVNQKTAAGEVPLVCAAKYGRFDFFGALISRQEIDVKAKDDSGVTAYSALESLTGDLQRKVWAFRLLNKKGIPMPSKISGSGSSAEPSSQLQRVSDIIPLKDAYDQLWRIDPRRWFFPSRVAKALDLIPRNCFCSASNVWSVIQACQQNPSRFERFCMRFYTCFDNFFASPLMKKLGEKVSFDRVNELFATQAVNVGGGDYATMSKALGPSAHAPISPEPTGDKSKPSGVVTPVEELSSTVTPEALDQSRVGKGV